MEASVVSVQVYFLKTDSVAGGQDRTNFAAKISTCNNGQLSTGWATGKLPIIKRVKRSHLSYKIARQSCEAVVGSKVSSENSFESIKERIGQLIRKSLFQGEDIVGFNTMGARRDSGNLIVMGEDPIQERIKRKATHEIIACFSRALEMSIGKGATETRRLPGGEVSYQRLINDVYDSITCPEVILADVDNKAPSKYTDFDIVGRLPNMIFRSNIMQRAAIINGLSFIRFSDRVLVLQDENDGSTALYPGPTDLVGVVGHTICENKSLTKNILEESGMPVARGRSFEPSDYDAAREYVLGAGFPVVLKPEAGVKGGGVVTNIRNEAELKRAYEAFLASKYGVERFIVERHLVGLDYRIMVLNGKVVACLLRMPAQVIGDGVQSIAELIAEKNSVRRRNAYLKSVLIKYAADTRIVLERQGLSLASVLEKGKRALLATAANLSLGGDSIDVTDELHPSIASMAARACRAVGIEYCGVDVLMEDHTQARDKQSVGICELNSRASVAFAEYPVYGLSQRVSEKLVIAMAEKRGLKVSDEKRGVVAMKLNIRGRVTGSGYEEWFSRQAEDLGLVGKLSINGRRELIATLQGPVDAVSSLASLAIKGPKTSVITSVRGARMEAGTWKTFKGVG